MRQNHLTTVIDNIRSKLSALSFVQTLLEASDAATALGRIYFYAAKNDGTERPPRMVVRWGEQRIHFKSGQLGSLEVWITTQMVVPAVERSTESRQARWAATQHESLVNAMRTSSTFLEMMLDEANCAVMRVPPEEIAAGVEQEYVWESFIALEVEL